ncbi:MAG TPA: hypothetical protein VN285_12430 [Candidatus Deferrimicrobium sp.]|nr:hypothetical protein [Candidatus Deferrimicrobium sp.]
MAQPKRAGGAASETGREASGKNVVVRKGKLSTSEARRDYQRRYYQMHKEKAKEYQRLYNLTHKKKLRAGKGKNDETAPREVVRNTYNTTDIMHSPVEKTIQILERIIKGERFFTM